MKGMNMTALKKAKTGVRKWYASIPVRLLATNTVLVQRIQQIEDGFTNIEAGNKEKLKQLAEDIKYCIGMCTRLKINWGPLLQSLNLVLP